MHVRHAVLALKQGCVELAIADQPGPGRTILVDLILARPVQMRKGVSEDASSALPSPIRRSGLTRRGHEVGAGGRTEQGRRGAGALSKRSGREQVACPAPWRRRRGLRPGGRDEAHLPALEQAMFDPVRPYRTWSLGEERRSMRGRPNPMLRQGPAPVLSDGRE